MLTLPIKGKWYGMIRDGKKLEEYRADTPYYAARFAQYEGQPMRLRLRNGYRADSPTLDAVVVPKRRAGARPEWGGNPEETCWVLEILGSREIGRSRWVPCGNIIYDNYKCGLCGQVVHGGDDPLPRECPLCHAYMGGREKTEHGH